MELALVGGAFLLVGWLIFLSSFAGDKVGACGVREGRELVQR